LATYFNVSLSSTVVCNVAKIQKPVAVQFALRGKPKHWEAFTKSFVFAHGIGAVMRYISVAGSSTGIEKTLYNWYLKGKYHSDGSPYIKDGMFLPNGYHLSLLAYFCEKFNSLEDQVCLFHRYSHAEQRSY
jgi:hypothetical protein